MQEKVTFKNEPLNSGSHELHGGTLTPLNDLTETHMERLGWMRFNDEGKLAIYNGDTKIKIAHVSDF